MYNTIILTQEEYIQGFGKPNEKMADLDIEVLGHFISQATNQVDSLVSPYTQAGYLFRWYDGLTDTDHDLYKKEKLKKAIGSGVEAMIISGKFWVDNTPSMSSNINYELQSSSSDSQIEKKRRDIIQDLTSIGLLSTSNLSGGNAEQVSDTEIEDYVVLSKAYLNTNFLKLDSNGQTIKSAVDFAANPLLRTGNITGTFLGNNFYSLTNYTLKNTSNIEGTTTLTGKPILSNYKLVNCDVGGGAVQWGNIEGELDHQVDLYEKLVDMSNAINTKQEKLTAGANITIDGDFVISATGGGGSENALEFGSPTKTYMKGDLVLKMFPVERNANGVDLKYFGSQTALLVSSNIDNNIGHEPISFNDEFGDAEEFSRPLITGRRDEISLSGGAFNFPMTIGLGPKWRYSLFKYIERDGMYALGDYVLYFDNATNKLSFYESLIDNNDNPVFDELFGKKLGTDSSFDPNSPLLKNNFSNVLGPNKLTPKQALNTGDILLNATSGKVTRETDELHSRVNIGGESRIDNNTNAVPSSTVFVDQNGDKLSAIVMGGINTIIGVTHADGSSAEPAWDIVPANALTFDMSEIKSSNFIKYYKATSYGNNGGEVTKERIYPETDPNIVALVKKVDGQLNDPDGIDGKIIYFGEEIEKVKVKTNRAIMFYKSTVTTFINQNEFNTFKDTYQVREGDYLYVTTSGLIQVQGLKDMGNEFL